jgi:hypothetical protein
MRNHQSCCLIFRFVTNPVKNPMPNIIFWLDFLLIWVVFVQIPIVTLNTNRYFKYQLVLHVPIGIQIEVI